MPPSRVGLRDGIRRRSSLGAGFPYSTVRPGRYGVAPDAASQNVTFAPNVTPVTYNEGDELFDECALPAVSPHALFPPSQSPPPDTRRRPTGGKRRSLSHIPRPPNAFMLFRADFVRQKHVPGSIETSHISLSKIIGNIWRALPWEERENWMQLAKKAKAEHKLMYPNYKFRPVHNKEKKKAKEAKHKPAPTPVSEDDDRRADIVAQMMLDGKKGEDLEAAMRAWEARSTTATPDFAFGADPLPPCASSSGGIPLHNPVPLYAGHRRSSSVPLLPAYNQIAIPSMPFLMNHFPGGSRVPSPVSHISGMSRGYLGQRRASSVQPIPSQHWAFSNAVFDHAQQQQQQQQSYALHRDPTPLPEPDTSLFQSEYITDGSNVLSGQAPRKGFSHFGHNSLSLNVSPLEGIPPLATGFAHAADPYSASSAGDFYSATTYSTAPSPVSAYADAGAYAPHAHTHAHMGEPAPWPQSGASSAFSGSPALTEHSLADAGAGVAAPQPLHPSQHVQVEDWARIDAPQSQSQQQQQPLDAHAVRSYEDLVSAMDAEQGPAHAQEMAGLEMQMAHGGYGAVFGADGGYADAAMHAAAGETSYTVFDDMDVSMGMNMAGF